MRCMGDGALDIILRTEDLFHMHNVFVRRHYQQYQCIFLDSHKKQCKFILSIIQQLAH